MRENKAASKIEPVITPVTILEPSPASISTSAIQAEAMLHQEKADSLKLLATDARSKVNEPEDPNDRWVWQKQILLQRNRCIEKAEHNHQTNENESSRKSL